MKTIDKYINALNESRELIDRTRIRAAELRAHAMIKGYEDDKQRELFVNSRLKLEVKHLKKNIDALQNTIKTIL